jgi:hypothetical protein
MEVERLLEPSLSAGGVVGLALQLSPQDQGVGVLRVLRQQAIQFFQGELVLALLDIQPGQRHCDSRFVRMFRLELAEVRRCLGRLLPAKVERGRSQLCLPAIGLQL